MINSTWRGLVLAFASLSAGAVQDADAMDRPLIYVQAAPRPFDSRPADGPPTPDSVAEGAD
jgi:hypothetical protein